MKSFFKEAGAMCAAIIVLGVMMAVTIAILQLMQNFVALLIAIALIALVITACEQATYKYHEYKHAHAA